MFLSLMSLVLKLSYEIGGSELQYQQLMKPPKQCLGLCHLCPCGLDSGPGLLTREPGLYFALSTRA